LSPEQRGASVELARLRVEVAEDRSAMLRCLDDVRSALPHWDPPGPGRPWLALVAVALHGWYTGLETGLERVARAVDQRLPTGENWHRALLSQGTAEVPGVRPAVLPRALYGDLVELLEFRHFFRMHTASISMRHDCATTSIVSCEYHPPSPRPSTPSTPS
jgi:hypothetical protein